MGQLIGLSIDVSKIRKERLYEGKKGLHLNLMVEVKDEPDKFGNFVSAWENQTPDERQNKTERNYLGNGKILWEGKTTQTNEQAEEGGTSKEDLPF